MKSLFKIAFGFLVGSMGMLAACDDSDDNKISGFTVDTEIITLDAEGGTETVKVASGTKWVAKVSEPWLQIMPANGIGSTECKVLVDTTLRDVVRQATITFIPEGMAAKKVEVNQQGYGKSIGISVSEIELPNMGDYGKRFFDVSVITNVDFDIDVATDAEKKDWLTKPKSYNVNLDQGARPRTTKIRFTWTMNTDPEERMATVSFEAKDKNLQLAPTVLKVTQAAGPNITDDRAGDSIALIIMSEKLNCSTTWDTSEKLEYWRGVTLWERKDKEVKENPSWIGRVRSAGFNMLSTKEGIPEEVAKLTCVESLSFSSNVNTMVLYDLSPGTSICELQHLKKLSIYAYGISELPDEFVKLGERGLKELDLGSNNFTEIPEILTKENFPELTHLTFSGMRRYGAYTDLSIESRKEPGLMINVSTSKEFKNLLKWEKLEYLNLSYNLLYGTLRLYDFDGIPKYTEEDIENSALGDTIAAGKDRLVGKVYKVLPNATFVSMNLNYLTGDIPDWIMYHPQLFKWNPFTLFFTQDNGYDPNGEVPGFYNEPANMEYYYGVYPKARPALTE